MEEWGRTVEVGKCDVGIVGEKGVEEKDKNKDGEE